MPVLKRHTLQTKFVVGLVAIVLSLGLLFSVFLHFHLRSLMETGASDKALMILAHSESIQRYVRTTLRPAMYRLLPEGNFSLEGMSTSYVTRRVMNDLNGSDDQYTFRRVAVDARNPDFEANGLERELVERFRAEPQTTLIREFRSLGGEQHYIAARPVVFEQSCMVCHGRPDDAPREMLDRYGRERGFGRQLGEIGGVNLVQLPVQGSVVQIRETTFKFVSVFALSTLALFAFLALFFNRLVVHNLHRLTEIMRRHFSGEADQGLMDRMRKGDEIDELVASTEAFASHLREARLQLKDYAANLEAMVGERTQDLKREATERTTDVQLFVGLLNCLNQSLTGRDLLSASLEQIGRRFGADRVVYLCTLSSMRAFSWPGPCPEGFVPELPPDWRTILSSGETALAPGRAYVPVQTPEMGRGMLLLFWDDGRAIPPQAREVLHALGLQLGIALENLDALDSLLRQKDMLASVFEGISDPLLLADGSRRPILANRSARDLAGASGEGRLLDTLLDLAGSRVPGPPASQGAALPQSREVRLPDGRSFALHIYPLQGPSDGTGEGAAGHDQRLIVYARESTAEKRMLDQIQQGEKLVAVGNLAAGLAHEINNPLGVILCYAQLLKESLGEDQAQADLEVIVRNTKQAQKVLQDLLDFARPKTSRTGPCDPAEVVRSLAGVFTARAKTDGVSLDVDLPDPAAPPDQKIGLPLVRLDAATLEQILTNLLINAFDAVASDTVPPGQGRITLRAARRDGEVRLSVADNGLGIPAEAMGRIFDPFFTTKEVGKGTGLGLTMVYGLLQEYGGRIEAANNPGGGAVFTLHLPAAGTPARDTRTETAAEAAEETA